MSYNSCEMTPGPLRNISQAKHCSQVRFASRNSTSKSSPPFTHPLKLLKKKYNFTTGAGNIAPRFFDSPDQYHKFFSKFVDTQQGCAPMFTITTVCHHTSDSKHPLIMLTNRLGNRFFFGKVPEGAQRVLNENGFRMGRLKSIFLTGIISSWSDIGGLPGLFLTITDATSRGIDIFTNSSKTLTYVIATWRYFVFRKGVELNVMDTDDQSFIGDSNAAFIPIKIPSQRPSQAISSSESTSTFSSLKKLTSFMFPLDTSKANSADPDSYKYDPSEAEISTHVELPSPSEFVDVFTQKSLSYIIRFLPVRGKFDPVKAKALGVKPGLDFKRLTEGETVMSDKNEPVHSHQVMGESKSFPKVLMLDIPSTDYLANTIENDVWFSKSETNGPEEMGLVYHLLGNDIDFQSPQYVNFISKFPADCKHVISHPAIADDTLVFKTYAIHLLKLKCIMNNSFNLPYFEQATPLGQFSKLQSLQQFTIDPSGVKLSDSGITDDTWSSFYDQEVNVPDKKDEILGNSILSLDPIKEAKSLKDHVQIVTLGTGSALPSIHRNVLANLLRIPYVDEETKEVRFNSILLDGGENTIGSLVRNYGHNNREQLHQILDELSLIFLSHLHADHHLGIISVITAWLDHNKNNSRKLYLILPWQFNNFVTEWFKLEQRTQEYDMDRIVYMSCEQFIKSPRSELKQLKINEFEEKFNNKKFTESILKVEFTPLSEESRKHIYKELRIQSIQTTRAIHCYWAYSVSMNFQLNHSETFKVSFSGDTRPNPRFVDIGKDSDLLIHEASLDNDLIEEALAKKHTTIVEAIKVSELMNCPKIILTHFSARFSEKHSFIETAEEYEEASRKMKAYLNQSPNNIFEIDHKPRHAFKDMDICYANDLMTIRYNDVGVQKVHYTAINELSVTEESEEKKIKEQKEMLKKSAKREAKRMKRLSMGRKQNVKPCSSYVSDVLIKRFIQYLGPNNCSIKYTPLVRIYKFLEFASCGGLVALVNDSTHKIVVLFTREAMKNFEFRYGQPLTLDSARSLVIIRDASLRFVKNRQKPYFASAFKGIRPEHIKGNSLLYLEVNEVEFFSRDQHNVSSYAEAKLKFVYTDDEYKQIFMAGHEKKLIMGPINSQGFPDECLTKEITCVDEYDGMVSEVEDEDSTAMTTRSEITI
ncbi:hypothetical protein JCM33374_g2105 [Metschnikowia sp. JCM 33374]|nr:hypothetical protein JCM33374_g2105 [Metschnikowia sp. JCM 33374]